MKIEVPALKNKKERKNYSPNLTMLLVVFLLFTSQILSAQIGTWTALTNKEPNENMGVMLLMTDGTIMCHNNVGGTGWGTGWDRLTPSATGSYINGTWNAVKPASMYQERYIFASQVLPNGKLFVAGGEYGQGDTAGELYDPVANTWTKISGIGASYNIYDGNSEMLPNGKVLVGPQVGPDPSFDCLYYNPTTNSCSVAPKAPLNHDEAAWLKLPDSSILFVGIEGLKSCRFRPQTNTWINDATAPDSLYDPYGEEAGSAVLLPNGKAIFFGATGHNLIYTPSGTAAAGTWVRAADFPFIGGVETGMVDAPSAMMVNGHILCAVGPINTSSNNEFLGPIYFVEYNYLTNTFTQVTSTIPGLGTDEVSGGSAYMATMLDLPDGNVMLGVDYQGTTSEEYYIYTPGSAAIAAGKPTINSIIPDGCPYYKLTGKLFNGISEGAQYGDDIQNSTNYPLIRLTNAAGNVYYCKTTNWNRIGAVMTDSLKDTTVFETPATLPAGTYSLVVVVNGFVSNPTIFSTLGETASVSSEANCGGANGSASTIGSGGLSPYTYSWTGGGGSSATATGLSAGTYTVTITDHNGCTSTAKVTITQSSSLGMSASATANVECNGVSDGTATANVSGGTAPYTYTWTGGKTTAIISGLSAGTYTVEISDHSGCTGTATVTITQPTALSASASVTANASCSGNTGSASSSISGGTSPYTYSWTGGGTNATTTGLSAGTYTLNVTDHNGCTHSASVTITQSSGLSSVSASANSNVKCNGLNNGSASATVSGGTAPYTYSWSGGAGTNATATGLSAGNYTVTVTDHNGCSGTAVTSISEPTALSASASVTANASCSGNTGSASSSVSGGTSPYTYSWTGGGTNATATGLSAGTYILNVTDNNGCTHSASVTITQSSGLSSVSASASSNIKCNGLNDGSASASVSGGTAPYTYSWSGGAGTNATATGLSAGNYTVTVTDHNGCSGTAVTSISQPTALSASASVTANASCSSNTGSASSSVSGGTSPYTYSWTGGGTNATATGLSAGTYILNVTDNNGCTHSASVTITQSSGLSSVSATANSNVKCNGSNNGSASASVSGGTSPYTYSWSGGAGTNATATGLSAGNYTVTVTDHNGCSGTAVTSISQPTSLAASANVILNANCGGNNGSASAAVSGGTSPYTYSWSSGAGTNATATGLSAGIYTLNVTDNNGCTHSASVTITQSTGLSNVSANITSNVKCNGANDGSLSTTVAGGTGPYTYAWSSGAGTNSSATGLSAGNYTVTVTDKNGCSGTAVGTITQPSVLSASGSISSNATCGGNNGRASATASGGTSPYTYSWTGGATSSSISGLSGGTYIVTITDNNGCGASASVIITQSPGISNVSAITSNVKCNGENDGSATATVSGGTTPYTYAWQGGGTSSTDNGLSAGTYTLSVTDKNGCSGTTSAIITEPVALSVMTYTTATTGTKVCDGKASVTTSGGSAPYTYSWSPGGATTDTLKNACAGEYCCTITDNNGCIESTCVTITVNSTGVESINSATDINAYPDPNTGYFTVAGVIKGQIIELYNILGQQISSITADKSTVYFNISNQSNGVYLIRIVNTNGDIITLKKIVKTQ